MSQRARHLLAAWPVALLFGTSLAAEPLPGLKLAAAKEPFEWSLSYEGKPLLVYAFAPQKFKPYVKELRTLRGDNILRDAPFDHLHHHGLMYAIKVNGLNFWEEASGSGVQKPIATAEPALSVSEESRQHLPRGRISQVLHWVASADAFLPTNAPVALLVEHRTLVLTVNPQTQEVALEWTSRFSVGPRTNTVALTGANYHGLGIRFLRQLDPLAAHSFGGRRPDLANRRQEVALAPWAAVSFDAPGHPATIALAGHPANARGETTYFSMLTPFAYLSATQALDKEPLVYHSGDSWELRFLVLLYPEPKPSEAVQQRITAWRQAKPQP